MHILSKGFKLRILVSALALLSVQAVSALVPSSPTADPARLAKRTLTPAPIQMTQRQVSVSMVQPIDSVIGKVKPFVLKSASMTGNTAMKEDDLSSAYHDLLGKKVTREPLYGAANTITERYINSGYPLASTQVIVKKNGVEFHVNEGTVGEVKVEGPINPTTAQLLMAYGEKLKTESPLTIAKLERYALLADDVPGLSVKTIITPSKAQPGAMDITFNACFKPTDAYLSYDNRGTRIIGREEFLAGAFANSWLGGNRTGIEGLATSDFSEQKSIGITHQQFFGSEGMNWSIAADRTDTEPSGVFGDVDTRGTSHYFGATVSYPVIRSRQSSLFVHGTLDAQNSRVKEEAIDYLLYNDKLRSIRLGATYDYNDRWQGQNQFDAELSHGIDGLGAKDDVPSNTDGDLDYTKMTLDYNRWQYLTSAVSYRLGLRGQMSGDSLMYAEQMGFGGSVYGRGYDPSEIAGDYGIAGKVELRYDWYPSMSQRYFNFFQLYGLFDAGKVWNHNKTQFNSSDSATSAGIGVRFNIIPTYVTGNLEVDKPLSRDVYLEGNRNSRVYFGITASI